MIWGSLNEAYWWSNGTRAHQVPSCFFGWGDARRWHKEAPRDHPRKSADLTPSVLVFNWQIPQNISSACLLSAGLSLSLDMWARGSRRQQRKNFLPPCTSNPCPGFSSCSLSLTPGEKQKGAKGKNKDALSKYIGPVVCWDERENPCWLEPPSHLLHGGDWPRQQSMRFDYNYYLKAELKLFRACRAYGSRQASKITFGLETPRWRDGTKRQTSQNPPTSTSRRAGLSLPVCDRLHAAPAFSPALADTLLSRREKPHLWPRDHGPAQPD